ncbi:hypothetical protein [Streptomyces sp. NPDC059639]|uniref:hypothetical protein n=1 Tax=Streptomyces sp. NPDC059639 TaxID=3346891 RepID=UPI00367A4FFE
MMPALRSRVVAAAMPLALAGLVAGASGAHATTVKTYFDCRVFGTTGLAYALLVDADAPAEVGKRGTFDVTFDPAPITPNPAYNQEVRDVRIQFKLPEGATVVSHEVADGGAAGTPTLEVSGTRAVLTAAGPYVSNQAFDLPKVTFTLRAGAKKTTLETAIGGTSHDDPGFTWNFTPPSSTTEGTLACWPDQPIALTKTVVK